MLKLSYCSSVFSYSHQVFSYSHHSSCEIKLPKITAHCLRNREAPRLQLFEVPEQGHEATVLPQVVPLDVTLSSTTLNNMIAKINSNN